MKKIITGFIAFLCLFLFAGCEKKKTAQKISNTPSANEFHIWTVDYKDFIDAVAKDFLPKAGYNNVQVKITKFDSHDEMQTFLIEKMSEDLAPDVVLAKTDWVYLNRRKLMALKDDPKFTSEAFDGTFVKSATEPLLFDGALLGIPLAVETLAAVYNREIFIDSLENRNVPGKTWDEIKIDAQKLTQTNNSFSRLERSGIALGDLKSTKYGLDVLKNMLVQNGVSFFSPDGKSANFMRKTVVNENGANTSVFNQVIQFFASFANPQYKQFTWSGQLVKNQKQKDLETFVKGDTAMTFVYPSDIDLLQELIAKTPNSIAFNDISTAFFPQQSLQDKELTAQVSSFVVPKSARNPLVSWEFLKYVSKKEVHQKFFETTRVPSARLDLIVDHAKTPLYDVFVRQAKFARTLIFPKPIPQNVFDEDLVKIFDLVKFGGERFQKASLLYQQTLNTVLEKYFEKDDLINKLRPKVVESTNKK